MAGKTLVNTQAYLDPLCQTRQRQTQYSSGYTAALNKNYLPDADIYTRNTNDMKGGTVKLLAQ